jgi:AAA+ ATPase superfamily predicted ATPase
MESKIIGREQEKRVLQRLLDSDEPELLALYGRRRVGKTFLVKEFFEEKGRLFELTGEKDASLGEQLQNFAFAYHRSFPREPVPRARSWREALQLLATTIDTRWPEGPVIVFFDELPWLASRKSRFLQALDHFWNSWGNRRRDLLLVVCGSASSWMIGKLIDSKGGLYNRVTAQIRLMPYTLHETELYLESRGVNFCRKDILELYMCMGGIPHYLRQVEGGLSVAQNIDQICFAKEGVLRDEFMRLFASLFAESELHVSIIRALAIKRRGVAREEILKAVGVQSGGGVSRALRELEESNFLTCKPDLGNSSRGSRYRLTDEYSLFYLTWLEKRRGETEGYWLSQRNSRSWQSWAGFSFEALCLKHVGQIKKALGIAGVSTVQSGWHATTDKGNAQIDLVLDRADNCINLFEMKFSNSEFTITKAYAEILRKRVYLFQETTKTRKNLFLTLLATFGAKHNAYFSELVAQELTMDCLFD